MELRTGTGFGVMLRSLRSYRGWSQEELARRVGANPSYISYLERGLRIHPSAKKLAAFVRVFELEGVTRQKFYNEAYRITPLDKQIHESEQWLANLNSMWCDLHDDFKNGIGFRIKKYCEEKQIFLNPQGY